MYKLINQTSKQEFICEKIEIDGYEYYAYSEKSAFVKGAMFITIDNIIHSNYGYNYLDRVIIATNNPSLDIPQIVDEVEEMAMIILKDKWSHLFTFGYPKKPYPTNFEEYLKNTIKGYNKAKEQYTNTKQDMIEFAEWIKQNATTDQHFKQNWMTIDKRNLTTEQVLELFEKSRPKTIYFK